MYKKVCTICSKEFETRIPHQERCSKECNKKHLFNYRRDREDFHPVEIPCEICGNTFLPTRKSSVCCSEKCKRKLEHRRLPLINKRCLHCGEEFQTKQKETVYCSTACINSATKKHDDVTLNCKQCNMPFTVPYLNRDRLFCSKACAAKNMNDSHPEIGEKVSKALKEGYASGELTHPWTGKHHSEETKEKIREAHKGKFDGQKNPMFAKKHSDYSRNKMSCTKAQKIVNGESNVHLRGKIYCSKIDKEVIYRSSWEKIVLESLDMSTDVSWFSVEPFSVVYLYDRKRRYTPDLLIRYTDSTRPLVLVEIKPSYFIKAAINQAKFKAAEEYCKEKGFIFEVWTEEKIKELARLLNQTQET